MVKRSPALPLLLLGILWLLGGCGGLDQVWEGPRANTFHPRSLAVLPPIVGDLDGASEPAHDVIITSLRRENLYDAIIGVEQINAILREDKEAISQLISYYNRLETTGRSDPETARRLGEILHVEALLIVKVTAWEYARTEGDNLAKVVFSYRLVDAGSGATVWRLKHRKVKTYMFFKPPLRELATELADEIMESVPRPNE